MTLTLEQRVAALEEQLAEPAGIRPAAMTDDQAAEFAAERGKRKYEPARALLPVPVLTPETARALLRECVTVVGPGETLVIRVPESWHPGNVHDFQRYVNEAHADGRIAFPVLVVHGAELGVARPEAKAAAHSHRWVTQPVTGVTFGWKCGCGKEISLDWRPEWSGLGFRDVERVVAEEFGGTVVPYEPPAMTGTQAAEFAGKLAGMVPGTSPELLAELLRADAAAVLDDDLDD